MEKKNQIYVGILMENKKSHFRLNPEWSILSVSTNNRPFCSLRRMNLIIYTSSAGIPNRGTLDLKHTALQKYFPPLTRQVGEQYKKSL